MKITDWIILILLIVIFAIIFSPVVLAIIFTNVWLLLLYGVVWIPIGFVMIIISFVARIDD
jgi:hypothetical protein